MDRFIDLKVQALSTVTVNLKSSLDRFIVQGLECDVLMIDDLKSSLDRFIAVRFPLLRQGLQIFKIQFG